MSFVTLFLLLLGCFSIFASSQNDKSDCNLCEGKDLPVSSFCFKEFASTTKRPWCPSKITVEFLLYTRNNTKKYQNIKAYDNSWNTSNYDPAKPLKFIIHGYKGYGPQPWAVNLKDKLLKQGDMNVIVINWKKGARPSTYKQACANTKTVGVVIGQFISVVGRLENAHCIGYSLGGQVCGFAGKEVFRLKSQRIGRISGLDPAGPEYEYNAASDRLDKSDASFVDVIHTDAPPKKFGWGIHREVGHVDFFPNGGYDQPYLLGSTSHRRSTHFFYYSIRDWHYDPSLPGNWCTMGYHVNQTCRGEYRPKTKTKIPFRPLNIVQS